METTLADLKHTFYELCASLSIDEIVTNSALISQIERIEKMFSKVRFEIEEELV